MRMSPLVLLAATASTALAQAEAAPEPAPAKRSASASFTVYGDYTFQSDLDDGEGEVSVWRAGANLDMSFPVWERSSLGVSLRGERWGFDFNNATAFDSADGEPWDDVNDFAALVSFSHQCTDRWSAIVGLGGESGYAQGADFDDSLTGGGFVAASYKFNDDLTAGLGVSVRTVLEDDAIVFPLLLLDWKIAEQWRLTTSPGVSRRLIGLAYSPNDQITIKFGGGYERLDFRLDDDAPAPEGVGRYQRIPVGVDVAWKFSSQWSVSVYGGAHVWQEYQLDDEDGNKITEDDAEIAPFLGASLEWRF